MTARARLTILFALSAIAVAAALSIALLLARSSYLYSDAGHHAAVQAEMARKLIEREVAAGGTVTVRTEAGATALVGSIRAPLEAVTEYLLVLDTANTPVYTSRAVVQLSQEEWAMLQSGLEVLPDDGPAGLLRIRGGMLFVARTVSHNPSGIARIVSGVETSRHIGVPREFLVTIAFILPLIVLTAVWAAYLLLGRPFEELDRIADEVAAITDGRSLHRRLRMGERRSELGRLVDTLNAMIARLETSFLALRRFTADASHELKTPLAVLRADVERAMSDQTPQHERAIALEEALQETARMTDLVESLLTLARADEGRFDIVREAVDLKELVQDVYETALILGEEAGVSVTLPFLAEATVLGERNRLRQLFLNLVTNAIKYTHPGGRVDIGLGRHTDHAAFAVRDTGIGIAAADIPHLFDRFWRADRVRTRVGSRHPAERGGFGLGLSISQWIAQAHAGTLTVSSRLGKGSLFTVTLPLAHPGEIAPSGDTLEEEGLTEQASQPADEQPRGD
jgi:two-component system, OmpR family, sensor kinase